MKTGGKWRGSTRSAYRWRKMKTTYGITEGQYNRLLRAQGNKCVICSIDHLDETGRRLQIDHNHTTGKVRGLLCLRCNLAIGQFSESIDLLLSAIQYLRNHSTKT
jgi:ribonuclease PH